MELSETLLSRLEEEFELLDVPFRDRGARADDAIGALRAALSDPCPSYQGAYYRFSDLVVDPCAVQARVPIWIGGRTARSLRRAVELGDGWCPFGLKPADVAQLLAQAADTPAWSARTESLEVVLQNLRPVDPSGDPETATATAVALRDSGATMLSLRFVHHSVEHYVEQLDAMATLTADL